MKIEYVGNKKGFKIPKGPLSSKPLDFSKGPVEVVDKSAKFLLDKSPKSFQAVEEEVKK